MKLVGQKGAYDLLYNLRRNPLIINTGDNIAAKAAEIIEIQHKALRDIADWPCDEEIQILAEEALAEIGAFDDEL